MKTLFVSGSDTNVGKTWVTGAIAKQLSSQGDSVQVVKPIESGVVAGGRSDVSEVLTKCSNPLVTGYTLHSFSQPIAPVAAAELEGIDLEFTKIKSSIDKLPENVDWRIVEGAGSIATPVSNDGSDWSDLARALDIEAMVLVVEDRVGAIGQSRLVYEYAKAKKIHCGIWLNEREGQDALSKEGTLKGIQSLGIPIWGLSNVGQSDFCYFEEDWL